MEVPHHGIEGPDVQTVLRRASLNVRPVHALRYEPTAHGIRREGPDAKPAASGKFGAGNEMEIQWIELLIGFAVGVPVGVMADILFVYRAEKD